jgi:hypothetical protein
MPSKKASAALVAPSLQGQWIGLSELSNGVKGRILLDVDDLGSEYLMAFTISRDDPQPGLAGAAVVAINVPKPGTSFSVTDQKVFLINPETTEIDFSDTVRKKNPDQYAETTSIRGSLIEDALMLEWRANNGVTGRAKLPRSRVHLPSDYTPRVVTWSQFKEQIASLEHRRYLFRGQRDPWRLTTSFHRSGRANVQRFRGLDVPELLRHLSSRTKHVFNLDIPDQLGAFLTLVQHHGYPTPLLDWTYSPYVAAYFAYRELTKEDVNNGRAKSKVRIFAFAQKLWSEKFQQVSRISLPREHFSILNPLAIENERMVPQQGAMTVTNVEDIESYIRLLEQSSKSKFLTIYDLPVSERDRVLSELSYMGVTAGSLFPGMDGACEELKRRNFSL